MGARSDGAFVVRKIDYEAEKERIKREIEKEIHYITEENIELEREIATGRKAERKLKENENVLQILMTTYLGTKL